MKSEYAISNREKLRWIADIREIGDKIVFTRCNIMKTDIYREYIQPLLHFYF